MHSHCLKMGTLMASGIVLLMVRGVHDFIINIFFRRRLFTVLHHARFKIWRVVKSHVFFWFMIIIIFLNLIILSCDHYNSQPILNNVISELIYSTGGRTLQLTLCNCHY